MYGEGEHLGEGCVWLAPHAPVPLQTETVEEPIEEEEEAEEAADSDSDDEDEIADDDDDDDGVVE